jgi:uncharacterized membrane protein YkgB
VDHQVVIAYQETIKKLEVKFGSEMDLDAVLLLIGIQELGKGLQNFSKDEKMNLMHIAICTILEPFGYYKFRENDADGWPHFDKLQNIPHLSPREQEYLMKEAVTQYFIQNEYL